MAKDWKDWDLMMTRGPGVHVQSPCPLFCLLNIHAVLFSLRYNNECVLWALEWADSDRHAPTSLVEIYSRNIYVTQ